MNKVIITDSGAFFLSVIEYGSKNGLFSRDYLEGLKEKAAKMTVQFAKRYYTVVYEAHLWQATYNILGIISVALRKQTGGDIEKSVHLLLSEGILTIFRQGWTNISILAKEIQELGISGKYTGIPGMYLISGKNEIIFLVEKELLERISAEPKRVWIGYSQFEEVLEDVRKKKERDMFTNWFLRQYICVTREEKSLKKQNEINPNDNDNVHYLNEHLDDLIKMLLISLTIHESPKIIKGTDLKKIANNGGKKNLEILEIKINKIRTQIPPEKLEAFNYIVSEFLELCKNKLFKEENFEKIYNELALNIFIESPKKFKDFF